ncbi:metallophosphoesterase [Planctomicrobium sp. SH527]|uniref:metallophosphoesterase n=1 Tax=Planctomicrobium sp. SH527 TaxID=3448123 RepID=UPI003F5B60A3
MNWQSTSTFFDAINWTNAGLFLLLTLGHTAIWIAVINRLHGLPWSNSILKPIRHIQDLAVVSFPFLLTWFVGLNGPQLLQGGSWAELNWTWRVIVTLCSVGFLGLLHKVIRHNFLPAPRQLVEEKRTHVDIAAQLGSKPIANGPYLMLAKLPWNEQYQVELTEKTIVLPNLPSEWDGLVVLHLSDWHFSGTISREYFESVTALLQKEPVDLICFSGDLIDNAALIEWIPETLGKLNARFGKFYILGNHDWYGDTDATRQCLKDLGWTDVASTAITESVLEKTLIVGGDETPWMGTHPTFPKTEGFRLLLSHTPDNFPRACRDGIDLVLAGHNHGGQVRLPGLGPVFAPSIYGCKYASGTFWADSTFMHVSRGLAGIHPLRFRCLPEVTRLTLKSASNSNSMSHH